MAAPRRGAGVTTRAQTVIFQIDPASGHWIERVASWTQLEDGLNYFDPDTQSWVESRAEIEITATGAVARHGQHRVIFSPNANDPEGAIDF